jgi:serine/threonine protein kinase/membrane-associated protease RseP (regulator of RpoE activity)
LIISYLFFPLGGLGLLALVYLVARRVNCLLSCKMPSPAEAIDAHAVEVDVETAAVPTAGGSMDAAIPHMSTKTLELVTKSAKEELGITLELLVGRFGLEVCCLSITEGSPFATSGFLAKDRLVAINGQPVPPNPQAAIAMVKGLMPGTIRVEVARERATERAELVKCAEHHNEQLATQAEAMRALKAEIEELPALEKAAVEATDYIEAARVKALLEATKAERQALQENIDQLTQKRDALEEAMAEGDRADAVHAAEMERAAEEERQRQKIAAAAALTELMAPSDLLQINRPVLRLAIDRALAVSADTIEANAKLEAAEEAVEAQGALTSLTAPASLVQIDRAALSAAIKRAQAAGIDATNAQATLERAERVAAAHAQLALLVAPTDVLQIDCAALRAAIKSAQAAGADAAHAQATLEKAEVAVVTAELAKLTGAPSLLQIDRPALATAIQRARAAKVDVTEAQDTLNKAERTVELTALITPADPLDIDCDALKKAIGRAQQVGISVAMADAKLRLALKANELKANRAEFQLLEKAATAEIASSPSSYTIASSPSSCTKSTNSHINFSTSNSLGQQRALESMAQWEFSSISIIWGKFLGAGGSGAVHQVQYGDEALAAKKLDVDLSSNRKQQEKALIQEFRALHKVGAHPNIVALLGVVTDDPSCFCLLMELANRGSLCQVLHDTPDEIVGVASVQVSLAHDVAMGLAFCHGLQPQPLLHHDIKSANILLFSADETGAKRLTAKLADFGLAVGVRGESTAAAAMTKTKTNAAGGTFAYRSPESFRGEFTTASEVYSYAIVLYTMLTGLTPWVHDAQGRRYMDEQVMRLVEKGKRPEVPKGAKVSSAPLLNLMRRCWDHKPKKRPSFEVIAKELKPRLPSQVIASFSQMEQKLRDLHDRIDTVDLHVQLSSETIQQTLQETILTAEARLVAEVRTGNAEVLKQMRLLHGSLLPEIQCIVAQQTLELSVMKQVSGSSGGAMGWLFGSKEEEEERLLDVQRSVKAAIEMADAKLRASVASVAASADNGASAEILKKLAEMQSAMEIQGSSDTTAETMLLKLDEMSSYLAQMDGRMTQMRLETDESAREQARQLGLVHAKLDTLLTGSHEQVFHYFILVPKPYKGYMGRTIDKLQPRLWFAKPMLLIPLYKAASGELRRAPVSAVNEGFEVVKPHEFVRKHPRAVQLAMLVLKAGIKMGAAQLGVSIPAESLDMLCGVTDALVSDTLQLAIEAMEAEASDEAQSDEAATAPPEEVLERLSSSDEYKAASRQEYTLLMEWLDKLHPGWRARCGLEPTVNQETGSVEWVPATGADASPNVSPVSQR